MNFPGEFSSVTQKYLAVPSPPIVETLYVYFLSKFVVDDDDDDEVGGDVRTQTYNSKNPN